MNAINKYAAKQHLTGELVKTAKLRMSDVEDRLDLILDKEHHENVRNKIKDRTAKSFSLRHPYLTGIPTLGIAPSVAKERAVSHITRNLLREHKGLRKAHAKGQERHRQNSMEDERLSIERARAEAPVRAVGAAMAGASPLAIKYLEQRRGEG